MSTYPYKHKEGNLLYQVETYRFRYQGVNAATIELFIVPGEKIAFEFEINENKQFWPNLPSDFKYSSSNDIKLLEELEMECVSWFETKEEALQKAINIIESLLNKYYRM